MSKQEEASNDADEDMMSCYAQVSESRKVQKSLVTVGSYYWNPIQSVQRNDFRTSYSGVLIVKLSKI